MSEHSPADMHPDSGESESILVVLEGKARDLGGFTVRRALPSLHRRRLGPFVFFDHMGPVDFPSGHGISVRPHPHIALATVTFLFEGEIVHRDSLGSHQTIRPGDVNWMVAGKGIVHSERSAPEAVEQGSHMHGIQSWVGLPTAHEEVDPRFEHHPSSTLPVIEKDGVKLDVIIGTAYGQRSPVGVLSPTLYVHAHLPRGARLDVCKEHHDRGAYVVEGEVVCDGRRFGPGALLVLRPGADVVLESPAGARVMLLGGAPLDGERYLFWNFVSSSKDRLEQAKDDWKQGRFPKVPGDELEFIPLPEG